MLARRLASAQQYRLPHSKELCSAPSSNLHFLGSQCQNSQNTPTIDLFIDCDFFIFQGPHESKFSDSGCHKNHVIGEFITFLFPRTNPDKVSLKLKSYNCQENSDPTNVWRRVLRYDSISEESVILVWVEHIRRTNLILKVIKKNINKKRKAHCCILLVKRL